MSIENAGEAHSNAVAIGQQMDQIIGELKGSVEFCERLSVVVGTQTAGTALQSASEALQEVEVAHERVKTLIETLGSIID